MRGCLGLGRGTTMLRPAGACVRGRLGLGGGVLHAGGLRVRAGWGSWGLAGGVLRQRAAISNHFQM